MTEIHVIFFASLRDAVGVSELQLEAATVADLFSALTEQLSADAVSALTDDNVRIAVNQELLAPGSANHTFAQGDEVAFLPPITGG